MLGSRCGLNTDFYGTNNFVQFDQIENYISDSVGDDDKPKPITAAMRQKEREDKRKKKKEKTLEKKRKEKKKNGTILFIVFIVQ